MNKNNKNNNDMIERIEFINEITRFRNSDQYAVILKIRSKRNALRTDKPNEPPLKCVHTISNNEPNITIQSKRLNEDWKYFDGPMA